MAKYKITDPQSGKTVTISGDKPPTQADAEGIFEAAGLRQSARPTGALGALKGVEDLGNNQLYRMLLGKYQQPGTIGRQAPAGGIEQMLFPRGSAIQDKQIAGDQISPDERVGQVGEGINRSVGVIAAGNPLVTGVTGTIEGATAPGASPMERLTGGAVQGAGQAATSAAFNVLGKVIHPFKTVGKYKAGQLEKVAGKTISGDKLLSSLEKGRGGVSPTMTSSYDRFMDVANASYKGKQIPVDQAAEILSNANTAYNASNKIGKAASARFNDQLAKVLRDQIKEVAPGVSRANRAFSALYTGQGVAKKLIYPMAGTAGGLGLLRLLGIKLPIQP